MPTPLVLLPGLMCDATLFAAQIADLSRDRPVMVAPLNAGERIEELASNILVGAPSKFALCGHGLGGSVALEILRRAPDRVTRLALIATRPLADTPQEAAARELRMVRAKSGKVCEALREDVPPVCLAPGPGRLKILAAHEAMAARLGPSAYLRQARALQRRPDQQAVLRKCRVPALVMGGAHDTLCPPKKLAFVAELIPHAQCRVLEDAGHLPTLEQPEESATALREWLGLPYVLR